MKTALRISLSGYLMFTSVLMVFLQGFTLKQDFIIDIKLFYFFLIINSIILYGYYGIKLNKNIVLFLSFIVIHSLLCYLTFKIPITNFIKQLSGTVLLLIYYYNIYKVFPLEKLFSLYLKITIVSVIIALIFYPFNILDKELYRLDGLMTEPSKFVIVLIPALYYFLKNKKYWQSALLILSILLAKSSVGFIGLFIIGGFLAIRMSTLKYFGITLIPIIILVPFLANNDLFRSRFDSIIENLEFFETKKMNENTNVSAFVLLKSAFISVNNFMDHPLGTGIGSFESQHDKYLKEVQLPRYAYVNNSINFNREDANSLFFRTISDFGIFGLLLTFTIIILGISAHLIRYDPYKKSLCIGVFIYLLLKLLRMGHYFPEEFYFFIFLFFLNLPKFKLDRIQKSLE